MNDKSRLYIVESTETAISRIVNVIGAIRKPRSDEVCIGNKRRAALRNRHVTRDGGRERGREKEIARTNGGKRKGARGRTTNGERSIGTLWYRAATKA